MGRTLSAEYIRNRPMVLAASDLCHLCGHPGATTVDHLVLPKDWPAGKPGVDSLTNLAPAHGTMGPGRDRAHNRCPVCGKLCNQSRGARFSLIRPQSRRW